MKAKLIVISAPSGAGKTTVVRRLEALFPEWKFSVSCTTRPKRSYEKEAEDYEFVSDEEFERRRANGELLEYEEVHGYFYGTPVSAVEVALRNGTSLILEVDVNGALAIKAKYPEESVTVFIHPPSMEALKQRLRKRGADSEKRIEERLERVSMEMEKSHRFDIEVVNEDIDRTISEITEKLYRIDGGLKYVN